MFVLSSTGASLSSLSVMSFPPCGRLLRRAHGTQRESCIPRSWPARASGLGFWSPLIQDPAENLRGFLTRRAARADALHDVMALVDSLTLVHVHGIGHLLKVDHIRQLLLREAKDGKRGRLLPYYCYVPQRRYMKTRRR